MTEEVTKYLVAPRGFSADGKSMAAGEYLTDQFDDQMVKVLVGMGRLIETTEAPEKVKPAKGDKTNRAVGLPGGLPGGTTE